MPLNTTTGAMRTCAAVLNLALCAIGVLAPWSSQAARTLGQGVPVRTESMPGAPLPGAPIPVKVVVVTMYEIGKLTGDKPGEAHLWVERQKLDRVLPFPLGEYELRMNDAGLLLICAGGGVPNSSSSIMALGADPRFDLRHAYWLVAGIAGGDPLDVSLGTAGLAQHGGRRGLA